MDSSEQTDTLRVLIVDDSAEVRGLLERSLRRLGHEVAVASDGNEGLKLLTEQSFQVVITDIQMPGIDGHTLLRRLSAQDVDTAVIVMSGGGTMDDVVDVLRAGAVDYLKKPWSGTELVSALGRAEEIYGQRRLTRMRVSVGGARPPADGPASAVAGTPAGPAVGTAVGTPVGTPVGTAVAAPAAPDRFGSLLDHIRQDHVTLPSVPIVITKLRILIAKPEADVNEISALIEQDPALATQLLRLSNTPTYARLARNNSIKGAIGRIGLRQTQSLVQTIIMRQYFTQRIADLRPLQLRIAQQSVAWAISFRALAELLGGGKRVDPEIAYISGLVADAGASFLLWVVGENSGDASTAPTEAACLELLQNHHEEIGGRILRRWGMDAAVIAVAQTHHSASPPAPPSDYWNLAVLGSELAHAISPTSDPLEKVKRARISVERCATDLMIGPTVLKKLESRVRDEFQSTWEALS